MFCGHSLCLEMADGCRAMLGCPLCSSCPRVPSPTTCKLPVVFILLPVLSLMLDVSANLLLNPPPPSGQDSSDSMLFHLPFLLKSFSSPFLADFPLAHASPALRALNLPSSTLCCTSSFPYKRDAPKASPCTLLTPTNVFFFKQPSLGLF